MGDFSKWLLHEDQNALFGFLFAAVFALVFLGVAALLLWPLDRVSLAVQLAKGYVICWIVLSVSGGLLFAVQRVVRVNLYDRADAYVSTRCAAGADSVSLTRTTVGSAPLSMRKPSCRTSASMRVFDARTSPTISPMPWSRQ